MRFVVLIFVLGLRLGLARLQLKYKADPSDVDSTTCEPATTVTVARCASTVEGTAVPEEEEEESEEGEEDDKGKKKKCGGKSYDPTCYVCRGDTLCPIINGEALSLCSKACYSKFRYQCNNTKLQLRPELDGNMILTVLNSRHPELHGRPVTVCNHEFRIGGKTCSYCPDMVRRRGSCPPGNMTVLSGANGMAVMVPGGQGVYLTESGKVGVGTAHSGAVPPGARLGGFKAYVGGGFVDAGEGARGWAACGEGPVWTLRAKNVTSKGLEECVGVNLGVKQWDGYGAWEYR